MGFLAATGVLCANQLRRLWRAKRTWIAAALCLLPVLAAALIVQLGRQHDEALPAISIGWILQVQVIVPILALILGSAAVAEEVEDRTLSFPFSRPIPRPALLWGRWLASTCVLSVLLAASTLATLAVLRAGFAELDPQATAATENVRLGAGIAGPLLGAVLIGGLVYSAVFAALGTLFRHTMIIGLGYVFAVEGFVANLPGKTQSLTIQFYLRSIVAAYGSPDWLELEVFTTTTFDSGPEALLTLGTVLLVALFGGSWLLSRRQYVLPA